MKFTYNLAAFLFSTTCAFAGGGPAEIEGPSSSNNATSAHKSTAFPVTTASDIVRSFPQPGAVREICAGQLIFEPRIVHADLSIEGPNDLKKLAYYQRPCPVELYIKHPSEFLQDLGWTPRSYFDLDVYQERDSSNMYYLVSPQNLVATENTAKVNQKTFLSMIEEHLKNGTLLRGKVVTQR